MPPEICGIVNFGNITSRPPHFSTALFLVNKRISSETLDYFYGENGFVSIETPFPEVVGACRLTVPCICWIEQDHLKYTQLCTGARNMALNIAFRYDSDSKLIGGYQACPSLLFIGMRYIMHAIRLINHVHSEHAYRDVRVNVLVIWHLNKQRFSSNMTLAKQAVSAFKSLRTSSGRGGSLSVHFNFHCTGKQWFPMALVENEIRKAERQQLKPRDPLENCEWAFQQAEKESEKGNYGIAEGYLRLITSFLRPLMLLLPHAQRNLHLLTEADNACTERFIRLAINRSLAKEHHHACIHAANAIMSEGARTFGKAAPEQKAYLLYTIGCILSDTGNFDRADCLAYARGFFLQASKSIPEDCPAKLDIDIKIGEIKTEQKKLSLGGPAILPWEDFARRYESPPHAR